MPQHWSLIDPARDDRFPANDDLLGIRSMYAAQQPDWAGHEALGVNTLELTRLPGLVDPDAVRALTVLLGEVARGRALVLQSGDCAEDPAECGPAAVYEKIEMLHLLATVLSDVAGKPVVRVGRMGGQFAKPRSCPVERRGGVDLPVFRGHMVNDPAPDPVSRRHDPHRLLACYRAASSVYSALATRAAPPLDTTWTSHEALILDYDLPLLRDDRSGHVFLSSTHWPWIGDRTRQTHGAHVRMMSIVDNPVACKVGPTMSPGELGELCRLLDPNREPGRLTLIARQGAGAVERNLPALVKTVRAAGHPVIWLCDPMHGNSVTTRTGIKTRVIGDLLRELRGFHRAVTANGGTAGGLHLEATAQDVRECVSAKAELAGLGARYTSLCDPRLNLAQATRLVSAWRS